MHSKHAACAKKMSSLIKILNANFAVANKRIVCYVITNPSKGLSALNVILSILSTTLIKSADSIQNTSCCIALIFWNVNNRSRSSICLIW